MSCKVITNHRNEISKRKNFQQTGKIGMFKYYIVDTYSLWGKKINSRKYLMRQDNKDTKDSRPSQPNKEHWGKPRACFSLLMTNTSYQFSQRT